MALSSPGCASPLVRSHNITQDGQSSRGSRRPAALPAGLAPHRCAPRRLPVASLVFSGSPGAALHPGLSCGKLHPLPGPLGESAGGVQGLEEQAECSPQGGSVVSTAGGARSHCPGATADPAPIPAHPGSPRKGGGGLSGDWHTQAHGSSVHRSQKVGRPRVHQGGRTAQVVPTPWKGSKLCRMSTVSWTNLEAAILWR